MIRAFGEQRGGMSFFYRINRFVKTPAGGLLATLVFSTLVGSFVTYQFAVLQAREAREAEQRKASADNRAELVNNVTRLLSERKTWAGLVASAITNKLPADEIRTRWQAYQAAYVDYNTTLFRYKAATGLLMGPDIGEALNASFDKYLTPAFTRIDACITRGYGAYVHPQDATPPDDVFRHCEARQHKVQFALDHEMRLLQSCIGAYDDVLTQAIVIENEYDKLPDSQKKSAP